MSKYNIINHTVNYYIIYFFIKYIFLIYIIIKIKIYY